MSYNDKTPARGGGLDEQFPNQENGLQGSTLGTRIHLPRNRKFPPPTGTTGRLQDVTYVFPEGHGGNVGLVLADGVIGVDVDEYDGKHGTDTMRARVQQWAPSRTRT